MSILGNCGKDTVCAGPNVNILKVTMISMFKVYNIDNLVNLIS